MSRLFRAALAALSLVAVLGLPTNVNAASPVKVAIIVGPVGALTPTYLALADAAAAAAEQQGAVVARAYSPNATPANVLAAVADAHVVVYFGHGYGHPSPYGGLNTARQNGWALQGPGAHGTHGDVGVELQYLGEDWIVANARPAPGFVMIYSNTCYAPGASEGGHEPASASVAAQRVAYYSRKVFAMGGSAYFATDFDRGAADLVGRLLANRGATFGTAFAADARFVPSALTWQAHPFSAGQSIWLHRTKYTDGAPNYWYAFAGNPELTLQLGWDRVAPTAAPVSPAADAGDVGPGANISIRLSEPVTGTGAESVVLRDAAGEPVAASVAYEASTGLVTIDPAAPLALSSRYTVVIGDGIADAVGRPLAAGAWGFTTRLDADPLPSDLRVVLEPGSHRLLRFASDGSVGEEQILDVEERRSLIADRRARLPGREGSWLRVDEPALGAWWVAESGAAHAIGQVEDAVLVTGTRVSLPPVEHSLHEFTADEVSSRDERYLAGGRSVTVDRRRVHDGRTFLRLADTEAAGSWIETNPALAPTESAARRVLSVRARTVEARLVPSAGHMIFRFDAAGRVIQRRALTEEELGEHVLTTTESRVVGGFPFSIIASGELAGWALREGPGLRAIPAARTRDAAG
ncbi:MAG: Ig-like domain-containing protein [Chloroflexota bacterium]|nr:Ig-like domain-containing protein [Chloroflexota bacterium]